MSTISEENKVNQNSIQLTEPQIREWLVSYLADLLEIQPDKVDVETTFARYGLDSSTAVVLAGDLETWLGKEIEPTILYDYPTIADLAQYLTK
ncbi:acyl carrier protein [Nostoc sp. UHCC 0702]|nr:acyl carrier protein [Nostoc sp. UHCC 0702]